MKAAIYTNKNCEEASINRCRKDMAVTGTPNKFSYWGNDDVTFELGLDKFGVDFSNLDCRVDPKRNFLCWIKD